jgi:hypothetical protein
MVPKACPSSKSTAAAPSPTAIVHYWENLGTGLRKGIQAQVTWGELDVVAAEVRLGLIAEEDLPSVASNALGEGADSPALVDVPRDVVNGVR